MDVIILFLISVIAIMITYAYKVGGTIAMTDAIIAAIIGCAGGLITTILGKKFDLDNVKQAVNTRSSQTSVNQLADNLEKISTKEHMDHKFTEVKGSFDKVQGSFDLISEKMNSNQKITDKSLTNMDQFLNSIKAAGTDSGSVRDAISTINALASDNGSLNQKIRILETELYQKNTEINHLENEIQEKNMLVEDLKTEIQTMQLDSQHKERDYLDQIKKMQNKINDLIDERDNSLENDSRGYEPEL